jgi:hypothetical protein
MPCCVRPLPGCGITPESCRGIWLVSLADEGRRLPTRGSSKRFDQGQQVVAAARLDSGFRRNDEEDQAITREGRRRGWPDQGPAMTRLFPARGDRVGEFFLKLANFSLDIAILT